MVVGVSEGYTKVLEVNGVGYRGEPKQENKLVLNLVIHIQLRWLIQKVLNKG